jgi:hypothetical protein
VTVKAKLTEMKNKIEEKAPYLKYVVIVGATVALTLVIKQMLDNNEDEITLEATREDLELVGNGYSDLNYYIEGKHYRLSAGTPELIED